MIRHTPSPTARVQTRASGPTLSLEALEPRTLLSSYDAETLVERFGLPQVVLDLTPPADVIGWGAAGVSLGDINADGRTDFAISAIGNTQASGATGAKGWVFVYSGATGQVMRSLFDDFADFGVSLANVGDVNADGVPDLLVGSPLVDIDADTAVDPIGAAYIYSGATGAILRTFLGQRPLGDFGRAVAAAGRADGDTIPDVMVGAPNDGGSNEGRVYILRGADVPANQQIIRFFNGEAHGDRFGASIAPADLQTPQQGVDASPDYLIGAPGSDAAGADSGRAYLYLQSDGSLALVFTGLAPGDEFGSAVRTIKDATQATLIIGAPGTDLSQAAPNVGAFLRFDTGGNLLGAVEAGAIPNGRFGSALTAIGDVNDDGIQDFAVSMPGTPAGTQQVILYSARNASVIPLFQHQVDDLGSLVIAAGDVELDGVPDVLALSPQTARARVLSSFFVSPPPGITGASDDLTFIFYRDWFAETTPPTYRTAYAFVDGVYKKFSQIQGLLSTDTIFGVNNANLIAGAVVIPSALPFIPPSLGDRFIIRNGVRTLLQDAVTQIVGGQIPTYGSFQLVKVGNDGSILYTDDGSGQRSWLFKDGVLTFLWQGNVTDVNATGIVIGNPFENGEFITPVRRAADGAITALTGMESATSLTDVGVVYGSARDTGQRLVPVRWSNGTITILGPVSALGQHNFLTFVVDANNDGAAIVNGTYSDSGVTGAVSAVFTSAESLRLLSGVVFGGNPGVPLAMSTNGTIVSNISLLVTVNDQDPWTLVAGSPVSHAVTATNTTVIGLGLLGDIIVTQFENGSWNGGVMTLSGNANPDVVGLVAYADPRTGAGYVFVIADGVTYWGVAEPGAVLSALPPANHSQSAVWTSIVANSSLYITSDGRAVLVGTDAVGDLVIFFQSGQFAANNPLNWTYRNLTVQDIEAGGQTFIPIAGGLTTFATTWGGQNIAYLDTTGDVYTVWWAPGRTLWTSDNLSDIAGAPAITGPLTSLTTPWNGLNVIGTNPAGQIVTIWWAPDTVWQYAIFIDSPEAPLLDPGSLTTFTTPWNAMNIVGRDADSGTTVAYWWLPGFAGWRADPLITPSRPSGVVTSGRFTGGMANGSQILFAREASTGHLVEIFWVPGSTTWDVADITSLVA